MSETYSKPLPEITTLNKPFWDAAREKRLVMQRCSACADIHYPPSPVCPHCLSSEQDWVEVSGRGRIESWIDFHHAYWAAFKPDLPYRVCLVKLEEGPLLMSNLVGDTEGTRLHAEVRVVFDQVTDEITLPKFTLA